MSKKQLIILIIALAVIAAGAAAWMATTDKPEPASPPVAGNGNVPTPPAPAESTTEPTTTVTSDMNTSEWKTYRNEELGFQIEYPIVWEITEENIDSRFNPGQRITIKNTHQGDREIIISITGNSPVIPEFSFNSPIADNVIEGVNLHIENFPNGYCDGLGCTDPFTSWWLENNESFYTFSLGGVQKIEGKHRQIISTFDFIE